MMARLRRLRWLALVLLVAVPGLGGAALQLAHPCPVDSPWLALGHDAGHSVHDSHGAPADSRASAPESCQCVGACAAALAPAPITDAGLIAELGDQEARRPAVPLSELAPASRPLDLLPPTTAPPRLA
jgi:hypothetical protein